MSELKVIREDFSVYRLGDFTQVNLTEECYFVGETDEELLPVCRTCHVPGNVIPREDGQKAFRIRGMLDFPLIGALAKTFSVLAEEKIGISAVPIYNTDYILTKKVDFDRALKTSGTRGHVAKDLQEEDDKTPDQSCLQT